MDVWKFIQDKLSAAQQLMLLYVLESEGSSPGRNGFKMAVAADGSICGTIGGGIMEHKLVEKAKTMLQQNEMVVLLMRQYHDKVHTTDQSGMICSGRQVNVFIPLSSSDEKIIKTIVQGGQYTIQLSPKGLTIQESVPKDQNFNLQFKSEEDWIYHEKLNQRPVKCMTTALN
jgi:xanthine dehydrogenase accessory factor